MVGDGEERSALEKLAAALGVTSRVTFAGRVGDDEMIASLARCKAVLFPPEQEDYGFVTVEAFASRKAVVTCRDSGGPAELVQDGANGLICDPTPESVASALTRLLDDASLAEHLGAAALGAGSTLTWEDTVKKLVE
jgi:glycosyltransferase involved in cell wall biosynthesis